MQNPTQQTVLPRPQPSSPLVELVPDSNDELALIASRVERLEDGLRLLAHAMKRSHAELAGTLQEIRKEIGGVYTADEVEALLKAVVEPLQASVAGMAETVHGLPLLLASAGERLTGKIEAIREDVDHNFLALLSRDLADETSGRKIEPSILWEPGAEAHPATT